MLVYTVRDSNNNGEYITPVVLLANNNNKVIPDGLHTERPHLKNMREFRGLEERLKMNSFSAVQNQSQ